MYSYNVWGGRGHMSAGWYNSIQLKVMNNETSDVKQQDERDINSFSGVVPWRFFLPISFSIFFFFILTCDMLSKTLFSYGYSVLTGPVPSCKLQRRRKKIGYILVHIWLPCMTYMKKDHRELPASGHILFKQKQHIVDCGNGEMIC